MNEQPHKRYYTISEVADMAGLKPHVLRFWEKSLPMLRPRRNRAGNRMYTERDIAVVQLVRRLLYEEGYTVKGARDRLKSDRSLIDHQLELPFEQQVQPKPSTADIRNELNELLAMVESL